MSQTSSAGWDRRYLVHAGPRDGEPQRVVGAEGVWVHLADGGRLLDLHGQHMCLPLGHRHPHLVAALHAAVDQVDYVGEFMSHEARGRAATLLVEDTMDGSDWAGGVRFVCSGSEATEMAMMMARLFRNRPVIVTRELSYHGWTVGAAAATGSCSLRNAYTPPGGPVRPVPITEGPYPMAPAPLCAACPLARTYPDCKDADGTLACVRATERVIRSVGIERVAAFITEIWHGAGAFLVPDEYIPQIREMTRRLGILWIDDEAIGGPARTGRWWAFQHYGVQPDIMTTAKGVTGAAVPAGACVVSREIAEFFAAGSWAHGSTFSGHPLALAAVAATLEIIKREALVDRAAELGAYLGDRLGKLAETHPCVAAVNGRGLVWGIELVRDPATGERWIRADRWHNWGFDAQPELLPAAYVAWKCHERDVLLLTYAPNTVTLAPPLTITTAELDIGLTAIDEALTELDGFVDGG